MTMIASALVALLLAAEPAALATAREHLAAGRLDDVLFALDGQVLPPEHRAAAGKILAEAAGKSLEAKDDLVALQFAQMALRNAPDLPLALELAARACLAQQQYGPAERYADGWLEKAPSDRARVLRADIAVQQGEWGRGLELLAQVKGPLPAPEEKLARELREKARAELKERQASMSEVKALQRQLERAMSAPRPVEAAVVAAPARAGADVVIYTTAWCGYCKQAKAYLARKNIAFVERDIEKDPAGAAELAEKARRANVRLGGVPVIDFRGTLIRGFDKERLDQLSAR